MPCIGLMKHQKLYFSCQHLAPTPIGRAQTAVLVSHSTLTATMIIPKCRSLWENLVKETNCSWCKRQMHLIWIFPGRQVSSNPVSETRTIVVWLENYEDHLSFPLTGILNETDSSDGGARLRESCCIIYAHPLGNGLIRVKLVAHKEK